MIVASLLLAGGDGAGERVFSCSFGAKHVLVSRSGAVYRYEFGRPGRPEISVKMSAARGEVLQFSSVGTLDMLRHLRLRNGRYSYVVYYQGLTANYTKSAQFGAALAVWDGRKKVSNFSCRAGPGFGRVDLSSLPEDSPDYGG